MRRVYSTAMLSLVAIFLTVIPIACLPLDNRCVSDHCPAVDSEEWSSLQTTCCSESHVYHCQVSPDGQVKVICAEPRYCNATEVVVVTRAGVECRRCDPETQQRVTGPSHHHTDLPTGCGGTEDQPQARWPLPHRDGEDNDERRDHAGQINPPIGYKADNLLPADETSNKPTNQNIDSDVHEAAWYIVVILVSTATVALLVLGIIVYFVVKCYSNYTRFAVYKPM